MSAIQARVAEEAVGLLGGIVFFASWLLQAWESRRAGQAIVSTRFFTMRAVASALLAFEGLRTGSVSVFAVMAATLFLMLYNLWLIESRRRGKGGGRSSPRGKS